MANQPPEKETTQNSAEPRAASTLFQRARLLLIALLILYALSALATYIAGIPGRRQAGRVEAAIRATMPNYCSQPGERITVRPRPRPTWPRLVAPSEEWSVSCFTGATCQPLITVFISQCQANVVTAFDGYYTQTLAICP